MERVINNWKLMDLRDLKKKSKKIIFPEDK